jgi:hypothetical protein
MGKDKIGVIITRGDIIKDKLGNLLDPKSINTPWLAYLSPMASTQEVAEMIEQSTSNMVHVAKALQTTIFVANILLSKSLQDLWGMLNTQAITIHLMLYRCSYTLPGFVCLFNKFLSNLNQKDMYPTD